MVELIGVLGDLHGYELTESTDIDWLDSLISAFILTKIKYCRRAPVNKAKYPTFYRSLALCQNVRASTISPIWSFAFGCDKPFVPPPFISYLVDGLNLDLINSSGNFQPT
jgi:hypothetical protein